MSDITSEHNLASFDDPTDFGRNPGRSRYCYMCPPSLPKKDAPEGVFSDRMDEEDTVLRLLEFAQWLTREGLNAEREGDRNSDLKLRMQLPAVYTYFGQFVNHDISAPIGGMLKDVTRIPDAAIVTDAPLTGVTKVWRGTRDEVLEHFQNEHDRPLNLDSLYGTGPFGRADRPASADIRALYDAEGLRFRLAVTRDANDLFRLRQETPPATMKRAVGAPDILRGLDSRGKAVALIADRRNDQNLILSQLHLALMLLHNKVVDVLQAGNAQRQRASDPAGLFAEARSLVTRHYHWCILRDFLPALLSPRYLNGKPVEQALRPSRTTGQPFALPMEFTTAAFRFGHSMVSSSYDYNSNFGVEKLVKATATLGQLLSFTTAGGMDGLGGASQLPDHWVADWDRLTDPDRTGRNRGDLIDLHFAGDLQSVNPEHRDILAAIIGRNLVRGFHRRIPFGQVLAQLLDQPALSPEAIAKAMPRGLLNNPLYEKDPVLEKRRLKLAEETPAWLYFLCEAVSLEQGQHLGPTASHIIAETFVGLLQQDPEYLLGQKGKGWTPQDSPLRTAQNRPILTLRDLMLFASSP